jgi:TatA/E family protein of Tat protein translocase
LPFTEAARRIFLNSSGACPVKSTDAARGARFRVSKGKQVKKVFLFIFEGLGTSELLLILIVALVIFGPRKLPQLSRSLGKSLADFKRASEDFKQTWEKEVEREGIFKEARTGEAMLPAEDRSILGEPGDRTHALLEASEDAHAPLSPDASSTLPSTPDTDAAVARNATITVRDAPEVSPTRKRDWL